MRACPDVEPIEQLLIAAGAAFAVGPLCFVLGVVATNWRARADRLAEWRALTMLFSGVSDKDNRRVWGRAKRRAEVRIKAQFRAVARARAQAHRQAMIAGGAYRL